MEPQNPQPISTTPSVSSAVPPITPSDQAPLPMSSFESSAADRKADAELLQNDEHLVTVVHRTVIGIILIYLEALITVAAIIALVFFLSPNFMSSLSGHSYMLFISGVLLAVTLLAMILFVASYIYSQSRLLVSDKSLIQIIQGGLFNRKICRLSMSNVQDVSAEHRGFLPTIFGFGTLTVETAGEEDNFTFPYCPNPDMYAERILNARQLYVQNLDDAEQAGDSG